MRRLLGLVGVLLTLASAPPAWPQDAPAVRDALDDVLNEVNVDVDLEDAAIIRVGEDLHVSNGRYVDGDVIVVNGDVRVSGGAVVHGTVIAAGGDVWVATGARVERQAVAVNGDVYLRTGGSVMREAVSVGGTVHLSTGGSAQGGVLEVATTDAFRARLDEALAVADSLAPSYDAGPSVQPDRAVERTRTERRDIAAFGDNIQIPPDLRLEGDVALAGGVLDVAGSIEGDVAVIGGHVRIFTTGEIKGDMATLASVVERDVPLEQFGDADHAAAPGTYVVPWQRIRTRHGQHMGRSFAVVNLIILGSFGVVVLLFNLLLEPILESAEVELTQGYVRTLLVGLIIEAALPPLLVLLCITVVLIPLAFLLMLAVALGSTIAMGLVSRQLGRRLMGGPGSNGTLTRTLVGYLVLVAVPAFGQGLLLVHGPVALAWTFSLAGYFVLLTAMTLGLGAVTRAQFGRWSRPALPPPAASPAPTPAD